MKRFLTRALPMALVVACGASVAVAQTPLALSNIGQRLNTDDARMAARGFGMTVTDTVHPGFKNTASLAGLRHVVVGFTGYGEQIDSRDATGTRQSFRTYTPGLRLAVPAIKGRLALTAGFNIERSTQFDTRTEATWFLPAWDDTISGNEQFVREGSIFSVPLGAAWQMAPGLAVSGTMNLVRGNLRESLAQFYTEPAGPLGQPFYQPTGRVDEDKYHGTSSTVGALWAPGDGGFRVGASWTPSHEVSIERKTELNGVAERALSTSTMTMPEVWQAGFQVPLRGRWLVGGDALFQDFTSFKGREDWMVDMDEEVLYSFGLERARAFERRGGWNNLPLRLGASFHQWGYRVGGAVVDETTYSIGTGFPFSRNMGQLDVALSWSTVGDLETNGYESEVWRLTVSVTGLEAWW